jgi:hypothetical protein
MKITMIKTVDLKPYPNNPRKNDQSIDFVANSIKEFGFKVPIVVDKDNVIVAGHTRLKAAEKLGIKEVPCIVADDLTPSQIKAFRIADNSAGQHSEWDNNILPAELEGLDFDMTKFGLDIPEVVDDGFGTDFNLPDGDQGNIRTMTLTLTADQLDFINECLEDVEPSEETLSMGNTNETGNKVYEAMKQWKTLNK